MAENKSENTNGAENIPRRFLFLDQN